MHVFRIASQTPKPFFFLIHSLLLPYLFILFFLSFSSTRSFFLLSLSLSLFTFLYTQPTSLSLSHLYAPKWVVPVVIVVVVLWVVAMSFFFWVVVGMTAGGRSLSGWCCVCVCVCVFFFFGCGCGMNFMGCSGRILWVSVVVGAATSGGWVDFMDLISTIDLVWSPPLDWKEIVRGKNSCVGWKKGSGFFELMMRDSNLVLWVFSRSGGDEFQIVQLLF